MENCHLLNGFVGWELQAPNRKEGGNRLGSESYVHFCKDLGVQRGRGGKIPEREKVRLAVFPGLGGQRVQD